MKPEEGPFKEGSLNRRAAIGRIKEYLNGASLQALAFRGSFWLSSGNGVDYGLRFLRNIILARLLVPESFGLMAIILAVNGLIMSFSYIGIKEAIIQSSDGEDETYLNGAWWLSFVRSLVLFAVAMVAVRPITHFYSIQQYALMFRISFLALIFNGASSAGLFVAQKKMNFKKMVIVSNGGGAIGVLTAIGLSFWLHSVWALVIGYVADAAWRCLFSYIICPFIPGLRFRKEYITALLAYAGGIFGLPILMFIYKQTGTFFIGKMLSQGQLGLYNLAAKLAQMPVDITTTLVSAILLPIFAARKNDTAWISRSIIKATRFIVILGTPIALFAALYAKDILTIIYGGRYSSVALPFGLMSVSTLLRVASTPLSIVFFAIGRPQQDRFFLAVRAAMLVLAIYPAIKWFSLTGAAAAGTVAEIGGFLLLVKRLKDYVGLNLREYVSIYVRAFILSLLVPVVWISTHNASTAAIRNVFTGMSICMVVYAFIGIFALPRLIPFVRKP